MKPLTTRQVNALALVRVGHISQHTQGSCVLLARRGLVTDHGRYARSRGHRQRFTITKAGLDELRSRGKIVAK